MDTGAIARALEEQREELTGELTVLTAVTRDTSATIGFGKRVGEGTNEAIGRIERVGQAEALATKLADVERALAKISNGSYGICDGCGERIPHERLEAIPWATRCIACSRSRSVGR